MYLDKLLYLILLVPIALLLGSCKQDPKKMKASTVGVKEIWCDESLKGIIEQQREIFELAYKHTELKINYVAQAEVMKQFVNNNAEVIIVTNSLDTVLLNAFKRKEIYPRQYRFGKSAIAFIGNKANPIQGFSFEELPKLLGSPNSKQVFAIENDKSGIAMELINKLQIEKLESNVYALKTKDAIFEWVQKNQSGVGIIDWSEISDSDDPVAVERLNKVKLLGIKTNESKEEFVLPYQYNLNGRYPFTRDLYFIRKYGVNDVSLGFAAFICEERGQKIMLKAGLLPEYQTERWVEFMGLKSVKVIE